MDTQVPNDFEPASIQKKTARTLTGWLILALAVLAGLGAAYLAVVTLKSRESAALQRLLNQHQESTVQVVVPNHDIPVGSILDLSMVAARSIPADTAPEDIITPEAFDRFAGHRVNMALIQGRPILQSYLSGRRTLADLIDPHKLAMTFTVDNVSTMDGMLQPGDHVDVLWFSTGGKNLGIPDTLPVSEDKSPGETVRYIEHDLKIIATGTRTMAEDSAANINNDPAQTGQANQFSTVTIELSPVQIERLALAKKMGELMLVLRGHGSQVAVPVKAYRVKENPGPRKPPEKDLYTADTIEYIIGHVGRGWSSRTELQNLRRLVDKTGMANSSSAYPTGLSPQTTGASPSG